VQTKCPSIASTPPCTYMRTWMQPASKKTKAPAVAGVRLYSKATVPTIGRRKKAILQSDCSPIHAMVMLLYRILEQILWYDAAIRRTWVTAAGNSIAFKIAAKPLQIETWLLLTVYRNLPSPYPMYRRRLSTTYRLAIIHALYTDSRQTDDISYPRLDPTVDQKQRQ